MKRTFAIFLEKFQAVIKKSPIAQQHSTDNRSSAERMKQHFCEPIKVEEYEMQKKDVDSHLLSLLEDILSDENLSVTDRRQRLKKVNAEHNRV